MSAVVTTVELRADRLMRRRFGFVMRGSFTWETLRLGVAWRDVERAVIRSIPPWLRGRGPGG